MIFTFGGPFDSTVSVLGTTTLSYAESGVTFTFSISNGDGSNYAGIGSGFFTGIISSGANLPSQDVFTLDVTGAGQTRFDGAITFDVSVVIGNWTVNGQSLVSGTNSLTGPQSSLVFTNVSGGSGELFSITSLSATINCFCAGTRIATPDGPVAIEALTSGMRISTADGGETTVKWLGEQHVPARFLHPAKINPICITAGALGDNVPARDLFVSPDHAIGIDGLLINAGALVNGRTIYQVENMPLDGFSYFHVETDAHELLLAEGCAAETFIDYAGRDSFVNGDERAGEPLIPEMDMPRISAARLVPEAIRARLVQRAGVSLAA